MSTIIIPARYGSSRFPGKVLATIGGEPMISRVVRQCKDTIATDIHVVTDDERVITAVTPLGVKAHMSPSDIATGTDRIAFVAANLTDDIVINVQGDEPFIPPTLINELITQLEAEPTLNMNSACTPFLPNDNANDANHVKVVLSQAGYALYFSRLPIPFDRDGKAKPQRYRHIGIYGYRRKFLLQYSKMAKTPLEAAEMLEQLRALENGERIKMIITPYRPISVDTAQDLQEAVEYFEKQRGA
ncbi:MAG: 3-deoxy-manno-octulosonate cytidylyltransferase [Deferribacteraceae bacterium]|jgi:3-deoxy-manno-octulosonate cytidylyltransferase (CMP-KDO synthetase)|nr:3-deoxy-manno-octulosonate cytidylyltransferase [Deferribacteraceae bacterium]